MLSYGDYKFYLAIENARCTDYISEKLFTAIRDGTVPVVSGPKRAAYERLIPPDAFIHADDFEDVKSLATYNELSKELKTIREVSEN